MYHIILIQFDELKEVLRGSEVAAAELLQEKMTYDRTIKMQSEQVAEL